MKPKPTLKPLRGVVKFALCVTFLFFLAFAIGRWLIPYLGALSDKEGIAWIVTVWAYFILPRFFWDAYKRMDEQIYEEEN